MTVIEHFWFYGRLRGRTTKKMMEEAEEMVKSLGLSDKRNAVSSSLKLGRMLVVKSWHWWAYP